MDDLEMTQLCAKAMGADADGKFWREFHAPPHFINCKVEIPYDPLHDDAQAMALVKKFKLNVAQLSGGQCQVFSPLDAGHILQADSKDLNRAICECVAKLQSA